VQVKLLNVIKNIMHFRDRGCICTLRPLFVYATVNDGANAPWKKVRGKIFAAFFKSLGAR